MENVDLVGTHFKNCMRCSFYYILVDVNLYFYESHLFINLVGTGLVSLTSRRGVNIVFH